MLSIEEKPEKAPAKPPCRVQSKTHDQALLSHLETAAENISSRKLNSLIRVLKRGVVEINSTSNALMQIFQETRSAEIFSIIYRLNMKRFVSRTMYVLKRYGALCDPQDIIQEVFLSIYRYADSFREEHEHSFRNWSHSIIRNAILKHLKRSCRFHGTSEKLPEITDDRYQSYALDTLIEREMYLEGSRLYCLSLSLYLHLYNTLLTPREKTALYKAEVENLPYKVAAASMGIKVENFKMTVCRAPKKIYKNADKDIRPRQTAGLGNVG